MKRFVASIQSGKDKCCYADFEDSDDFALLKEKSEVKSNEDKKSVIIFDRTLAAIVHRIIVKEEVKPVLPPPPPMKRKGK